MLNKTMTYNVNFLNTTSTYSTHCEFSQLPPYQIKSIELYIKNNKRIVLEGFEKYLVVSSKYKFLYSKNKDLIDSINVLGKWKNEVFQISFHRKGKLFQCKNEYSQWRPLVLKPLKDKKFRIEYSKSQDIDKKLWRDGCDSDKERSMNSSFKPKIFVLNNELDTKWN